MNFHIAIYVSFIFCSLLLNCVWKNSYLPTTTDHAIEPSVIAGILVSGVGYVLHIVYLPESYQYTHALIHPYIILGTTTVIYHSIRRYIEIVIKDRGYSQYMILKVLQICDPTFVSYICIRIPLLQIVAYFSQTTLLYSTTIIVCSIMYYCKYTNRYNLDILTALGMLHTGLCDIVYIPQWYLRYNAVLAVTAYIYVANKWNTNCLTYKKNSGNTYPNYLMYTSDILAGYLIYRNNYNYISLLQSLSL